MPYYEKRAVRDGVPVSIQCILMKQNMPKSKDELHYHDYTELLFGIEGEVLVISNDKTYRLGAGDMAIIHNFELHDVDGTGVPSSYVVIKFLPSILLTADQSTPEYSYALTLMQNTDKRQDFFHNSELQLTPIPALFQHAMAEWEGKRFAYELSLRADVTSIFLHILRKWHEQNVAEGKINPAQLDIIERAIAHIKENYRTASEASAARAIGVSSSYLSRVFKSNMKRSFTAYLNDYRLKESEKMLVSGDIGIMQIADAVGFKTSAYFISVFKKQKGMTPAAYRKMYGNTK